MLNNINSWGLSKSEKVEVLNFPGATSNNIVRKTDDGLHQKPELLVAHVGTNDLTNEINLLKNKKIVTKAKQKELNTVLSFSNIIICKDKKNLEKLHANTNSKLLLKKNVRLINHDNITKSIGYQEVKSE